MLYKINNDLVQKNKILMKYKTTNLGFKLYIYSLYIHICYVFIRKKIITF